MLWNLNIYYKYIYIYKINKFEFEYLTLFFRILFENV